MTGRTIDENALLSLRDEQGFSFPEIGEKLGIHPEAARGSYRRAAQRRRLAGDGWRPPAAGLDEARVGDGVGNEDPGLPAAGHARPGPGPRLAGYPTPAACPNFDHLYYRQSFDTKRVVQRVVADLENRRSVRLAIISDTHGVNVDHAALDWALREIAAEGAEAGIHAGDTFDYNNQSDRHLPTRYVPWESELDGGALTLRALEDTGLPWLMVEANHDVRPDKQFAARLPAHYLPWVSSPLQTLVDRVPNVWLPDRPPFERFWLRVGDIIAAHVEAAAGVESVARKGYNTFTLRGDDYGLDESPIRGVFAGHPHKFRQEFVGRRAVVVDLDCLQRVPGYALTGPGVKYKNPASQGIVFATLNHGKLDIDSVTHRVYVP